MSINKWIKNNTRDLTGKTIVITGGTGGLGSQAVKILAGLNANIVLTDRNLVKAESLKREVLNINKNIIISHIPIDLCDYKSLVEGIKKLKLLQSIDALILNAGVYYKTLNNNINEYNDIFKTNFISQFYLTRSLLDMLKNSKLARVVYVGSISYKFAKLNNLDIDYSKCKKQNKIYGNSKRFLMCALTELFKGENEVSLSIVHPGVTLTNITRHYPKMLQAIIKIPMKIVFNSPKKSSLSIIKGLFEKLNSNEWIGPRHFDIWGYPKTKKIKQLLDSECEFAYNKGIEICNKIDEQIKEINI